MTGNPSYSPVSFRSEGFDSVGIGRCNPEKEGSIAEPLTAEGMDVAVGDVEDNRGELLPKVA